MDKFDLKKYLAEGKLLKEKNDDVGMINYLKSLPDQYDMSNSQYDLWEDIIESIEGFTSQEIKNYIKDLPNLWDMSDSQYDLWEDIIDDLDLKKYLAEGKILKEESINEAWINNWFDLLLNGALIVSALQYSLSKAGLSLKDPKGIINKVDPKSIIKKVKDGWKYMTNKKVYDIVKKLINDPDILQAAKVELRGPRGGKRKLDNQIAYQQVLKSKLSEEELNILKAFSDDLIKKDFTKDLKARTYKDNGSYPWSKSLKNTYDFKKYKDDTEGEESVNEGLNDRISKIEIGYTDQGKLYSVKISDASGKRIGKLHHDDVNDLLKMLDIKEEIPLRISRDSDEVLNNIVKQLQDQGIEASWDDFMDVSEGAIKENPTSNSTNVREEGLGILNSILENIDKLAELDEKHGLTYGIELETTVQQLYDIYNNITSSDGETHGY